MNNILEKTCFLCPKVLTKANKTNEHIIKNSIGGRKKVQEFICDNCNNSTGHEWDKDIDTYIGEFSSLLFGISRQIGKIKPKHIFDKNTGIKYHWSETNLNQITPEYTFDGKKLKIMAKDKISAQHYFKQLQSEGKIPNNVRYQTEKIEKETSDTAVKTSLKFEIPCYASNFSKSVVKSALALLSVNNYSALQSCTLAKEFLLNDSRPILEYYYHNDPIVNRPFATPLHTVYVFNEETDIYAYVELFGFVRYKIHLSDSYNEHETINIQYSIDPRTAIELNLNFDFHQQNNSEELHPATIQKSLIEQIYIDNHFYACLKKYVDSDNLSTELKDFLLQCYVKLFEKQDREFISLAIMRYKTLLQDFLHSIST